MTGTGSHHRPAGLPRARRFSARRRTLWAQGVAARFGLWALFLQILLPLGQGVPLPVSGDGLPRHLVVCAANGGLRTIPLPGAPASQSSSAAQNGCAVCLAYAAGGHLTLPPPMPEPLPRLAALARIDQTAFDLAQHQSVGLPQARAPPGQGLSA
jgi:hypothetical protein